MKPINRINGQVAPLDRAHVDTDQIIPKQFLKSIRRTGFGDFLFDSWRFVDEGALGMTPNERRLNHQFVLNRPEHQDARILLARDNFGCGSSREHAVWALLEYGFEAVLAPSFADIFYNNCFKNGLLPITLDAPVIDALFAAVAAEPRLAVHIDLEAQSVRWGAEQRRFELEEQRKQKLLLGLDDIEVTLAQAAVIREFESEYRQRRPWLFAGDQAHER